jgi:hypothetical protein
MNIFWLDPDLDKMARYHCDKHIVKMPTECGQMLSDVMRRYDLPNPPHRKTNPNHPCTKWAGDGQLNYELLRDVTMALCKEYTRRYGKIHKIQQRMEAGEYAEKLPIPGPPTSTPKPNCTTFKDIDKPYSIYDLYRMFYIRDKKPSMDFKYNRGTEEEPWFMGDRFYMQQIEAIGDCPGSVKSKLKPPKKQSKQDLLSLFPISGLDKLRLNELQVLKLHWEDRIEVKAPTDRLKKPYVDACAGITDQIDWTRCTIATLKQVIEHFNL